MKYSTIEDLQSLIDNEIEESTELEYKSSFATENPKWKEELAKDVSAMANANGGTIIYGIREKDGNNGHAIPNELLPISYKDMSKDKLSQLLSSNIQPVIDNVEINIIPNDDNSGFFIVQIPQSHTAHQNKVNHQYFKRRNATVEVMEDYEIRDVMNRTKHPVIELEFELHKTIIHVTEKPFVLYSFGEIVKDKHYTKTDYKLHFWLTNKGKVYAKYINYFIHIPVDLYLKKQGVIDDCVLDDSEHVFVFFGDNTVRDITSVEGLYRKEYGPIRYDPLLPGVMGKEKEIGLNLKNVESLENVPPIEYALLADNAPERKVKVNWKDIKVVEKEMHVTKDHNNLAPNLPL